MPSSSRPTRWPSTTSSGTSSTPSARRWAWPRSVPSAELGRDAESRRLRHSPAPAHRPRRQPRPGDLRLQVADGAEAVDQPSGRECRLESSNSFRRAGFILPITERDRCKNFTLGIVSHDGGLDFSVSLSILLSFAGCSHREEIPKITREEYAEVQQHFPSGGKRGDPEYFASARGQQLVSKRLRQIFGDLGLSTMRGATKVEVFRIIDPNSHPTPRDRIGEIEGYPIIARRSRTKAKPSPRAMSTTIFWIGKLWLP